MLVVGVQHLRDIFYRMGLSDKDIVALSGGHTLVFLSSEIEHMHLNSVDIHVHSVCTHL